MSNMLLSNRTAKLDQNLIIEELIQCLKTNAENSECMFMRIQLNLVQKRTKHKYIKGIGIN